MDWSTRWREGLGSRSFGRLTVTPSWTADPVDSDGPTVVLDPETAFGSGEHGSTRVALALLEHLVRPGDLVLDLGSGSGILALAAVKLGAARAIGIENDPEANVVAARNASRNRVERAVELLDGEAGDLAPLLGPADLVLSNILRSANIALLPAIAQSLRPEGTGHLFRDGGGRGAAVPPGTRSGRLHGARRAQRHRVVGCCRAAEMIRVLLSGAAGRRGSGAVCRRVKRIIFGCGGWRMGSRSRCATAKGWWGSGGWSGSGRLGARTDAS